MIFVYPKIQHYDSDYNQYWHQRKITKDSMNDFQRERAILTLKQVQEGESIMDIGVGNGAVLSYIHERKPMARCIGIDISDVALAAARENGVEGIKADISKEEVRKDRKSVV